MSGDGFRASSRASLRRADAMSGPCCEFAVDFPSALGEKSQRSLLLQVAPVEYLV